MNRQAFHRLHTQSPDRFSAGRARGIELPAEERTASLFYPEQPLSVAIQGENAELVRMNDQQRGKGEH